MKLLLLLLIPAFCLGQIDKTYQANPDQPFGKLNPEAPKEVADYAPLIGICDCTSTVRNPDQSWGQPQAMTWTFKYIMNGTAVQDETIKEDGSHSGSIRQFIADSSKWYVHYYSNKSPTTQLSVWEGNRRGDSIRLYRPQKAPNGMDGYYRITFSDMSEAGFNWLGEWVDTTESIQFPTWKIACKKRTENSDREDILQQAKAFSQAYMDKNTEGIMAIYADNAKLFPPGDRPVIDQRADIQKYWTFSPDRQNKLHKLSPTEITITGDFAHDHGFYEGITIGPDGVESPFRGKYLVVWQRIDGKWKMILDMWHK